VIAVRQIYCQILVPRGARARLLKAVDPTVGPPPGSVPADVALLDHLDELSDAKDWDALRALVSDDFRIVVGKRRFDQRIYIRLLKATERQFPASARPTRSSCIPASLTSCRSGRRPPASRASGPGSFRRPGHASVSRRTGTAFARSRPPAR
jgi:hypothetical protein